MRLSKAILLCLVILLLPVYGVHAQEATSTPSPRVAFTSPAPGEALLGTVLIVLEINPGTRRIEISFSYTQDPRETWFLIHEENSIDQREYSFPWDTTTITDGDYTIQVKAETEDGVQISSIPGLRVRNYSPIETSTPLPTSTPAIQDTLETGLTTTSTSTPPQPTSTSLPPNPALITENDIQASVLKGVLITFSVFIFLGIYQVLLGRRRKKGGD